MERGATVSNEISRHFGVVFETTSINDVAKKCARVAWYWGGAAMVVCNRAGSVEAFAPGTIMAREIERHRPGDVVGTYANYGKRDAVAHLIAGDILHHLIDAVGRDSIDGQRLRGSAISREIA